MYLDKWLYLQHTNWNDTVFHILSLWLLYTPVDIFVAPLYI